MECSRSIELNLVFFFIFLCCPPDNKDRLFTSSFFHFSDKPGEHDFNILRTLVLADGPILRARHAGRPTRDFLFVDPVIDGRSLLKIRNVNNFSGVLGVFNCQGSGGWSLKGDANATVSSTIAISGQVSPMDVVFIEGVASENWTSDCAVFASKSENFLNINLMVAHVVITASLSQLSKKGSLNLSLCTLQCEIYDISPIRDFYHKVQFAPLGLIGIYNSGGAIEDLNGSDDSLDVK
uniref:Putative galactinol--sucrose galactosyltransferase 2 n=1 Tax=Anthurium amnicola TaxID=1678845 RepID=A0A1D1YP59_9ARAE